MVLRKIILNCLILFNFFYIPKVFAAHALALGYAPKYASDFAHFDYVNPNAPKSGMLTVPVLGGFDTLNPFTLKGQAASGVQKLTLDTLAVRSWDEPFTMYGLLAKSMIFAPDGLSITFVLDERAQFSDGSPVLADDVLHSFQVLTSDPAAHPFYRMYWADVADAVILDPRRIQFRFKKRNAELHLILAELPVFSKNWAKNQTLSQERRRAPIGSGPYVLASFDFGKQIRFEKRAAYWAKNHPTRRGQFHFQSLRYYYLMDDAVRLEAFLAGEFDFIVENVAKNWARAYRGERFERHILKKAEFQHHNPQGIQGFVMNLRRTKFQNRDVRKALNLAFDFEWLNRQIFYNQYQRSSSFFSNSELAAHGRPSKDELALLAPFKQSLSKEVYLDAPQPSQNPDSRALRSNLIRAKQLLERAGWRVKNGVLTHENGEVFTIEFLLYSRTYERILASYQRNLAKLGIVLTTRMLDTSLYQQRLNQFDFDMTMTVYSSSLSPGNEMSHYFSSAAAREKGSYNLAGLQHPVVDALLDRLTVSKGRSALVTTSHALDRVLRSEFLLVPNWYLDRHRVVWWNRFEHPEKLPKYYQAADWIVQTWWENPKQKLDNYQQKIDKKF